MTNITKNQNIDTLKECNCCYQSIDHRAKVCNYCGKHQNFWVRHFGDTAIIVSIVMVIIAAVQMLGAIKQNVDASGALEKAENALNQVMSDANSIAKLKEGISYYNLVTKASNDDRTSFFELYVLATTNNKFQKDAKKIIEQIITGMYTVPVIDKEIDWQTFNLDSQKASLEDFYSTLERLFPLFKSELLYTVWKQERFEMSGKLQFLYKVITKTQSTRTLYYACKLMDKEAKLNKNFVLDYELYIKWWEENKERYNKNPKDQPTNSNE